jgi:hypothetical protein
MYTKRGNEVLRMTETVINTNALPEFLFRIISTKKLLTFVA